MKELYKELEIEVIEVEEDVVTLSIINILHWDDEYDDATEVFPGA